MPRKRLWILLTILAPFFIIVCGGGYTFAANLITRDRVGASYPHDPGLTAVAVTPIAESNQEKAETPKSEAGPSPSDNAGKTSPDVSGPPDEVTKLKEQIIELQNKGKLGFRKIVACSSVEGFGIYSPLTPGESITRIAFYCEPSNVSTLMSGDRYVIDCTVDVFLMDTAGKPLLAKPSVVKLSRVSRSPAIDLYFTIQMDLLKLAARQVIARIVLHDKIRTKQSP